MSDIQLLLTHEEVSSLCSALNEALECVEDWEFETRLGRGRQEIESLLHKLQHIETSHRKDK
jgi:hypothetical protein